MKIFTIKGRWGTLWDVGNHAVMLGRPRDLTNCRNFESTLSYFVDLLGLSRPGGHGDARPVGGDGKLLVEGEEQLLDDGD